MEGVFVMKRMNSRTGKEILSLVRHGDFAHPGEIEAIEMIFQNIQKNPGSRILDSGCGLFGTASYLEKQGYGKISGIELDDGIYKLAKKRYPNADIIKANVENIDKYYSSEFDIIYHFTSFYAFPDHEKALTALRKTAKNGAQLIIFDYATEVGETLIGSCIANPIDLNTVDGLFAKTSWKIQEIKNITAEFTRWYIELVDKIHLKKNAIIDLAGDEWFEFVANVYEGLLERYKSGALKGIILYADAL